MPEELSNSAPAPASESSATPAEGQPVATSMPPRSDGQVELSLEEASSAPSIEDMMALFGRKKEEQKMAAEPEVVETPAAPTVPPPIQPTQPPAIDPVQQAMAIQQMVQQQVAQSLQAQQPQPSVPTEQEVIAQLVGQYGMQIPPAYMEKLLSGDATQMGEAMSGLLAAQAARVHATLASQMEERLAIAMQQMPQQAQQVALARVQAENAEKELFEAYPDLNNQVGRLVIDRISTDLSSQLTAAGKKFQWSPKAKEFLGSQARAIIAQAMGTTPQSQGQTPAAPQAKATQPWTSPGTGVATRPSPKEKNDNPNSKSAIKTLFDD